MYIVETPTQVSKDIINNNICTVKNLETIKIPIKRDMGE